jgi:hypothetical protein
MQTSRPPSESIYGMTPASHGLQSKSPRGRVPFRTGQGTAAGHHTGTASAWMVEAYAGKSDPKSHLLQRGSETRSNLNQNKFDTRIDVDVRLLT